MLPCILCVNAFESRNVKPLLSLSIASLTFSRDSPISQQLLLHCLVFGKAHFYYANTYAQLDFEYQQMITILSQSYTHIHTGFIQ